jgi:ABC-2 type transport system permease protein
VNRVLLIFRHELGATVRRAGFVVFTVIVPAIALLGIGVAKLVSAAGTHGAIAESIGYVDEVGTFNQSTQQGAILLQRFGTPEEATRALTAGEIREYFVIPEDYFTNMRVSRFTLRKELAAPKDVLAVMMRFIRANLLAESTTPQIARLVESQPRVTTTRLTRDGKVARDQGGLGGALIPLVFSLLLVLSLLFSSSYLLQGLAEEKEERLMEVLVSRVSPQDLLFGKLLGLGAAGLVQVVVWLVTLPFLLWLASSTVGGFASTLRASPLFYVLMLVYFILGYLIFATLSACVGAVSTNLREGQQLSALFTLFPLIPLWFMSLAIAFPESPVWIVLSLFPLSAPVMVVERLGISGVPAWQVAVSLGILALSIVGGLWLSGKAFAAYLLMYGQRPGLREMLRRLGSNH